MRLDWDERKNRLNQKKHGIAFSLAARVFADECRILEKDRIDEETGQQRWHAIVSARDANQSESRRYFQRAAH